MAPFGNGQIRRFADRWYQQVASFKDLRPEEAKERAAGLQRAIFSSRSLRDLAERPLLLTLMASLHAFRGGTLPEEREKLYDETLELLLDVWERQQKRRDGTREPSLLEWLKVKRSEVLKALQKLAFEVHGEQAAGERQTADVPAEKLIAALMGLASRSPEEQVNPVMLAEYLSCRSGILSERREKVYTFPHRTFQEYLAARHLIAGGFAYDQIAELGRTDPGRWREVVLLAAARSGPLPVWDLADALINQGEASAEEDAWGLHLAAQALAETADLTQVNKRYSDRFELWRRRLADELTLDHLAAPERALAGVHLAKLGDPRFSTEAPCLPVDERVGFLRVPGGMYEMGSTVEEIEAVEEQNPGWSWPRKTEQPRHTVELSPFYIAKYPVTVAQFRAFVEDSGREPGNPQAIREVSNHPVVRVSWDEAMAYCTWLTERLCAMASQALAAASSDVIRDFWIGLSRGDLVVRLPSEAQWEGAARGSKAQLYPWGGKAPTPEHANYAEGGPGGPTTVGIYRLGRGPYGTLDQAGNVLEWCLDEWKQDAYGQLDGKFDPSWFSSMGAVARVVRGGAWWDVPGNLRAAYRYWFRSRFRNDGLGFRVVVCRSPEP